MIALRGVHFLSLVCVILSMFVSLFADDSHSQKLKVLHLTFHQGCAKEVRGLARVYDWDLQTWFIPDLPKKFFDGVTVNFNALYNMGHERAKRIWQLHVEEFERYDLIITSDTAPLARIFLQHGYSKPLIIWICNRFDYCDCASLDCDFPDAEFYDLFRQAAGMPNVAIIGYTPYENYYARCKGVHVSNHVIKPCCLLPEPYFFQSLIPNTIVKSESFFLPPYHNETIFMDFSQFCKDQGIPNYCGRYNGPMDLKDFKGIIHIPYAWSNLALFENSVQGVPYFIPSRKFFLKLARKSNFFYQNLSQLISDNLFDLSEWYAPDLSKIFIYFDSWDDLKQKIAQTDYVAQRKKIQDSAKHHQIEMLGRWKEVLNRLVERANACH